MDSETPARYGARNTTCLPMILRGSWTACGSRSVRFTYSSTPTFGGSSAEPLNRCLNYDNKEAGAPLAKTLEMGQSRPWPDALEALTGQRQMDATAIRHYFAPLEKWLEEQNQGKAVGWYKAETRWQEAIRCCGGRLYLLRKNHPMLSMLIMTALTGVMPTLLFMSATVKNPGRARVRTCG